MNFEPEPDEIPTTNELLEEIAEAILLPLFDPATMVSIDQVGLRTKMQRTTIANRLDKMVDEGTLARTWVRLPGGRPGWAYHKPKGGENELRG